MLGPQIWVFRSFVESVFLSLTMIERYPLILSFCYRHLKQLGLGGEDSSFLRLTIGLAILAVGGIYAFRFFSNMRYLFSFVFRHQIIILSLSR